jgi:hypothetical protein
MFELDDKKKPLELVDEMFKFVVGIIPSTEPSKSAFW